MSDTITTERPKPKARRRITPALRRRIEEAVDRMIDALDALDAPAEDREPDDDEGSDDEKEGDGDSDDEPSLGAPDAVNQVTAWGSGRGNTEDLEIGLGSPGLWEPRSQVFSAAAFGTVAGRETDDDFEPSLGSTNSNEHHNGWCMCGDDEREGEDVEGDELDTKEASDLEISGESDSDRGGSDTVDHEPSLGSLDRRMNQTKWSRPDYLPRGVWNLSTDAEDDGLVRGEGDDADQERGDDDLPCDESCRRSEEVGITWPPIANANDAFGGVA